MSTAKVTGIAIASLIIGIFVGFGLSKSVCVKAPAAEQAAVSETAVATPAPAAIVKPQAAKQAAPQAAKKIAPPAATPAPAKDLVMPPSIDYRGSPAFGDPKAPKVIVYTFSDFQCPVCKRAAENFKPLIPEAVKGGDVLFVFKNNALDMHKYAKTAAIAARAAHLQGKFWDFHDKLFDNMRVLKDDDTYTGIAAGLGLDATRFASDRASGAVVKRVEAESAIAFELEARGTPSFFINGKKQVGWGSARGLARMIDREKVAVEKLMAAGKSREDALKERIKQNSEKPEFYLSKLAP